MFRFLGGLICGVSSILFVGCGGTPSPPQGTVVTITFAGTTPSAVATQIGSGPFTPAKPGNSVGINLPAGTTTYAVAYVCTSGLLFEHVIEATVQDGTVFPVNCGASVSLPTGTATGSVDASAIPGANSVDVVGKTIQGIQSGGGLQGADPGPFNLNFPEGKNDVAFLAAGNAPYTLAVKIIPSQNVPGPINSGNTVIFGPGDATTIQPWILDNIPAGVTSFTDIMEYNTANGTSFGVTDGVNDNSHYLAVPAAAIQSGDFYLFSSAADLPLGMAVGITQTTSSNGPVTLMFPTPWSFAGPAAATFPTFTFNYSGFSNSPAVAQQATISWSDSNPFFATNEIMITATANFQNGATTLTIPDLTSLPGFFASAASGTSISWIASIFGGDAQQYTFLVKPPVNGSLAFVQTSGHYAQP